MNIFTRGVFPIVLSFLFFNFSKTQTPSNNETLVFVLEHYRHGARSPCSGLDSSYTDIFNQTWNGFGELTHQGILQFFHIGLSNKEKYKDLISTDQPNPNEVRFYSTNMNRTIMSAQSLMIGLYYHNKTYEVNETLSMFSVLYHNVTLPFLGIPIRTLEDDNDNVGLFEYELTEKCPRIGPYREENMNRPIITEFINSFIDTYGKEFLLAVLKNRNIDTIDFKGIKRICSAYVPDYFDKRELPILEEYNIDKEMLFNMCNKLSYLLHFEIDQGNRARISGVITMSHHAKSIVNYMENIIYNRTIKPKYVVYSGHDTTVTALQVYLETAFNVEIRDIPFASCMKFCLFKDENGSYIVKYYFNEELLLVISFEEFKKGINSIAWKDYQVEDFCHIYTKQEKTIMIMVYSLFSLFIFNVVLISYNTCGKANKKQYQKFSNTANKNGDISMNHNNSSSGNQQMKEIELEKKTDNDV